jgi:uncharacterized Zn finger protein
MEGEIECTECGWQGDVNQLLCSEEDRGKDKPVFNICPECGKVDCFDDIDQDEEAH